MTPRQQELLSYLREYIRQHEYAPSFAEMQERLQLASKSGVHRMVQGLAEQGLIKVFPHRSRAISLVDTKTPARVLAALKERLLETHATTVQGQTVIAVTPAALDAAFAHVLAL